MARRNNWREFDEFISHSLYQSLLRKADIKDLFVSWLRYAILSFKRTGKLWIPYIGTLRQDQINKNIPTRNKKGGSLHRVDCLYIRFVPDNELKSTIRAENCDKSLSGLVDKIEYAYQKIMKKDQ